MRASTVRFLPSASSGITGYRLSIASTSGSYGSGTQVDIPIAAAQDAGGGVLEYAVQIPRDTTSYMAMRAYSNNAISGYSNEVVVPPAPSTSSTAAIGESLTLSAPAPGAPSGTTSGGSGLSASGGTSSGSGDSGSVSGGSGSNSGSGMSAAISLDFDGEGEYLASSESAPLGVSHQFSLSLFALADPRASGERALVSLRGGGESSQNRIDLSASGAELHMAVFNSIGQPVYQASYGSALSAGAWQHIAITFDVQIDAAPVVFVDGLVRAPTSAELTGNAPVFTDSPGVITVGGDSSGELATWFGAIGHVALFGVAIGDDEVETIWLGGHALDLRANFGAYQAAESLVHYWRLGEEPSSVGADAGPAETPIDLDDPAGGMDASDVVIDAPALLQ